MAEFFDISDWQEKIHYQTGGTRNKSVVENLSTTDLYFFKKSIPKYQHEFWSEIIASEVGNALGFNVLKYDIANKNGEVGCISKLMINPEFQQLTEGINYLQGYDSTYLPEKKESYEKYTFHFIEEALKEYNLEKTIPDLIRTIIFDSIIGNGDRHQENWGYIQSVKENDVQVIKRMTKLLDNKILRSTIKTIIFIRYIRMFLMTKFKLNELDEILNFYKGEYSPIYDSGSCLGREMEDEKVDLMLRDDFMLKAYVNKGTSEIRWDGPKLRHFELIDNIRVEHHYIVKSTINNVIMNFDEQKIRKIVLDIDKNLPENLNEHKLPDNRKELIIKMITLRIERLKELLQ